MAGKVAEAANGARGQNTIGAARTDGADKDISELSSTGSRGTTSKTAKEKILSNTDGTGAEGFNGALRQFTYKDIAAYGSFLFAPGTDLGSMRALMASDLNIVGEMIVRSKIVELQQIYAEVRVEIDHSNWSEKYSASSMQSIAYAQAYFEEQAIVVNARRAGLAKMTFYRVEQLIHEFRHLMHENNELKIHSVGTPDDQIEEEARTYAREFMIKNWRPQK